MSSSAICWLFLYGAIALEIAGTYSMKLSDGFAHAFPSLCVLLFYCSSICLMSLAVRRIDLGVAYAVWSGVGITGITIISVLAFEESLSYRKVISIAIIMLGVISLNLTPVNE